MGKLKKTKMVISLLTWQTSLIFISIVALVLSGVLVVASPQTRVAIQDKAVDVVKASFSDVTTVKINKNLKDAHIFVYDNLSDSPDIPLSIEPSFDNSNTFIELFPGSYKLSIIKKDFEPINKRLLLNVGQKEANVSISFQKSTEKANKKLTTTKVDTKEEEITYFNQNQNNSNIPEASETDDTEQKNLADLDIKEIVIYDPQTNKRINEPEPGQVVVLEAIIQNIGNETSYSFQYKWSFRKQGSIWQMLYTNTRPGIAPYEKYTNKITYSWKAPTDKGKYDIMLELDTTNNVIELNKNNNSEKFQGMLIKDTLLPDFEIDEAYFLDSNGIKIDNPIKYQEYEVYIIFENKNDIEIKDFVTTFYLNGKEPQSFFHSNFDEEGEVKFKWIPQYTGNLNILLESNIEEANDSNNIYNYDGIIIE